MDAAGRFPTLNESNPAAPGGLVRIGYIAGAHGLKGALRLKPDDADSSTLEAVRRLFLSRSGAPPREYRLNAVARLNRTTFRIALEGIATPEAADALRGAIVSVAAAEMPALAEGEFYYFQAIGCVVTTEAGARIGVVEEVFSNGANDVLVVREGGREILIPAIADVINSLDFDRRRIVIEALPGLLE
jgi:16S rRNA processing protein RimM